MKEKKTIWFVEDDVYSDHYAIGEFSSKENAFLISEALGLDKHSVREVMVNPAVKELNHGLWPFRVNMLRNGTTESVEKEDKIYDTEENRHSVWHRTKAPDYKGTNTPSAEFLTITVASPGISFFPWRPSVS